MRVIEAVFLPDPVTKDPGPACSERSQSADRMFRVDELEPIEELLRGFWWFGAGR